MNFRALEDLIVNRRRTGKSTALAFKAISEAMENPLQPVKIKDHIDRYPANKLLLERTNNIIEKVGLKGFIFNKAENTITYDCSFITKRLMKEYLKCECEGE